ncbi:MAG: endonuclease, partial [Oscillospiraceae bacterium]|nr:endonuclease [Oscillospiraceae bacterium]
MKHVTKRLLSILMVLSIITSLLAGITAVSAAGTYNTGVRGELCTSLSSQAKAYYTGSYTYDTLSTLSGSTLKSRISSLVTSDRDTVGYNGLKTYFAQTDAHLGSSSKLNLFYCNIPTNSAWDGADSYNREHMWPDSLGGNAAEGDLHSMRPTDAYVNSKRGNSKYGYVTGGKDATASPTNGSVVGGTYGGSYFEPLDFAKGDCARVILYDYATYSSLSSITTVFESVDVLLEWCALDPVDEFEMTRNDVVEDIQGCRNPFVDYPELAWIMLGKEIPTDMPTPTNEGGSAYTVTAASSNINNGTVSISGRVITATPAEGWYAASYQVSPEGAATVARDGNTFTVSNITADCTVTIHFAQSAAASIRYIVPDGVSVSGPTASYVGSAITLPTVSGKPSDTSQNYSFFGWATSPVVDTTSVSSFLKYDAGASYLVDDTALTFYAVYTYTIAGTGGSSDTFTKITAA